MTDNGVQEKREELVWFNPFEIEVCENPRTISNPGFTPERMTELREDIQMTGLKQALEIRMMPDGLPRLIAGERRLRSIQELVQQDSECFDRNTNQFAKASKVYAKVKCTVTVCDDKGAAMAAVKENLLHEHLTDYELLLCCARLEDGGLSRSEQAKFFGKSEAWVSQSHSLLKGHPKVLDALHDGTLGRTQALQFLNYPAEKVEPILARAIAYNQMEFDQKEKELLEHREQVYEKLEEKETELKLAEAAGDKDKASELRKEISEGEKEADADDKKLTKHRKGGKRKPRPSINNIQSAASDEEADGGAKRKTPDKIIGQWNRQLTKLLDSGEPLMNSETETEYSRREVRIIRDVLECVLGTNGFKSPLEALNVKDEPQQIKEEDDDDLSAAAK